MNIDERLEALTMNLELASRDIQDLRASLRDLSASVQDLRAVQQEGFAETRRIFEIVHDSIKGLENIAGAHEQRIEDLEKKH